MPGVVRLYDIRDDVLSVAHYSDKKELQIILSGWHEHFPNGFYYQTTPEVKVEKEPREKRVIADKPKEKIKRPPATYTNIKIYKYDE